MNIRSKIISIDIFFCELYKDFTTKGTKADEENFKLYPYKFSKKQKKSFYEIKTFVHLLCLLW
jgi:hypothetical protein